MQIKTVGELVEYLSEFDPDMPIVFRGAGKGAVYEPITDIDYNDSLTEYTYVELLGGRNGYSADQVNNLILRKDEENDE